MFLSDTCQDLKSTWARGITYNFCVACLCNKDALHFLDLDKCVNCTEPYILQCPKGESVCVKDVISRFPPQCSDVKNEGMEKAGALRYGTLHMHDQKLWERVFFSQSGASHVTRVMNLGVRNIDHFREKG